MNTFSNAMAPFSGQVVDADEECDSCFESKQTDGRVEISCGMLQYSKMRSAEVKYACMSIDN
jgi:hypothetical protein